MNICMPLLRIHGVMKGSNFKIIKLTDRIASSVHDVINKYRCFCLCLLFLPTPPNSGLHCPATFDDIMCWPETKAGTTAEQNCPDYVNNFNTRGTCNNTWQCYLTNRFWCLMERLQAND